MAEETEIETFDRIVMRAPVQGILEAATPWSHVRHLVVEDLPWLLGAAWDAYPHRHPFPTWDAMVESHQQMLRGDMGDFMPVASPVALTEDGHIAGALATVYRFTAVDDAPDCPYVLTCLTLPEHRRRGVASGMLAATARALKAVGETHLALTVDADNDGALALYARLGFEELSRGPAGS